MGHTLAGVTISVDSTTAVKESLYSQQQVLDATTTTIGYFGAKSRFTTLTFTLILDIAGVGSIATLESAVTSNADTTYVDDKGTSNTVRIMKFQYKRIQALNYTNAVYVCQADLVSTTG